MSDMGHSTEKTAGHACPHEHVKTFRSLPPHSKCLDCGSRVERRWVSVLPPPELEWADCTCGHPHEDHDADGCFRACGCSDPGPATRSLPPATSGGSDG